MNYVLVMPANYSNSANMSVGQVGLECGYNNSSHFHRQFKLYTGMTPLRYQMVLNQFSF